MNYWRGYLLAGKYTTSASLGCSVSYVGREFYASHNGGGVANHVETNRRQDSFRLNPAWIYFSPMPRGGNNQWGGTQGQKAEYAGGQIFAPHWNRDLDKSLPSARGHGGNHVPMATCPPVWIWYRNGSKFFEVPHRREKSKAIGGSMRQMYTANNYLFSDGSVDFVEKEPGWIRPSDF